MTVKLQLTGFRRLDVKYEGGDVDKSPKEQQSAKCQGSLLNKLRRVTMRDKVSYLDSVTSGSSLVI